MTTAASHRALLGDEAFLRSLEQLSIVVRRVLRPGLNGDHRGVARSNSSEFADYRSYSAGDDFRRIDWNLYGRLGVLFIRLSEAREDINVHLLLDSSRSMDYGEPNKADYGKRLAAALGYLALSRLDTVNAASLGFNLGDRLATVRGKDRVFRLLKFLDDVTPKGTTDLNSAMKQYAEAGRPSGVVVVISDLLSPDGYRAGLERLRAARLEVIMIQILSPQELDPTASSGDVELIDRETGEIVEVTLTSGILDQYQKRLGGWFEEIETTCAQLGVSYHRIATTTPLESAVLNDLRNRRILR